MNTISNETMQVVASSLLFVQDAEVAIAFLNDFCKDNKGYTIPAFNSKERRDEAANWKAALLKAGAKPASLSNLRVALNYGLECGEFLGANSARAKEALEARIKAQKNAKQGEPQGEPKKRATKVAKTDGEKLAQYCKQVLDSPALKAADFPSITKQDWSVMLRCLATIKNTAK